MVIVLLNTRMLLESSRISKSLVTLLRSLSLKPLVLTLLEFLDSRNHHIWSGSIIFSMLVVTFKQLSVYVSFWCQGLRSIRTLIIIVHIILITMAMRRQRGRHVYWIERSGWLHQIRLMIVGVSHPELRVMLLRNLFRLNRIILNDVRVSFGFFFHLI